MAIEINAEQLPYVVVSKFGNQLLSAHQHPDAAEKFRKTSAYPEDWKVVNAKTGKELHFG